MTTLIYTFAAIGVVLLLALIVLFALCAIDSCTPLDGYGRANADAEDLIRGANKRMPF